LRVHQEVKSTPEKKNRKEKNRKMDQVQEVILYTKEFRISQLGRVAAVADRRDLQGAKLGWPAAKAYADILGHNIILLDNRTIDNIQISMEAKRPIHVIVPGGVQCNLSEPQSAVEQRQNTWTSTYDPKVAKQWAGNVMIVTATIRTSDRVIRLDFPKPECFGAATQKVLQVLLNMPTAQLQTTAGVKTRISLTQLCQYATINPQEPSGLIWTIFPGSEVRVISTTTSSPQPQSSSIPPSSTNNVNTATSLNMKTESIKKTADDDKNNNSSESRMWMIAAIIFAVVIACILAVIGVMAYQRQQKNSVNVFDPRRES